VCSPPPPRLSPSGASNRARSPAIPPSGTEETPLFNQCDRFVTIIFKSGSRSYRASQYGSRSNFCCKYFVFFSESCTRYNILHTKIAILICFKDIKRSVLYLLETFKPNDYQYCDFGLKSLNVAWNFDLQLYFHESL